MKFTDIQEYSAGGQWECAFSLPSLVRTVEEWVEDYNLQMNPDFQRGHVWSQEQQTAYVEFLLKGGKTGRVIYLNNPVWDGNTPTPTEPYFVCVDGLQRFTAIKAFLQDEIKVFNHYYSEYEDKLDRVKQVIYININTLKTKKEVLKWYLEMNTGGTVHSQEEITRVTDMYNAEN